MAADPETLTPAPWLERLREAAGETLPAGGNRPFLLADSRQVWVIAEGQVDLFAVSLAEGQPAGAQSHFCRLETGQALFGMALTGARRVGLLGRGGIRTRLISLTLEQLQQITHRAGQEVVIQLVEGWIAQISDGLATRMPPRDHKICQAGETLELGENEAAAPLKQVLWVKCEGGETRFAGLPEIGRLPPGALIPLSPHTWVEAAEPAALQAIETQRLLADGSLWQHLEAFHQRALDVAGDNLAQAAQAERRRLREKAHHDQAGLATALSRLVQILHPPDKKALPPPLAGAGGGEKYVLYNACRLVGDALGVEIRPYPETDYQARGNALRNIARASRIRYRKVALREDWWRQDNGPMLAFITPPPPTEGWPVALLPTAPGAYELIDPASQTRKKVTPEVASSLAPFAYFFYKPFPDEKLTAPKLVRFGLEGLQKDLLTVALMGMGGGLLATTLPLVTGILFDTVIPAAARGQLLQLGLALLVSSLAAAMFELTQKIALLRIEGRVDLSLLPAVWDRLLRLPVPFFRAYTSGDLADRAFGISTIRRQISEILVSAVLTAVFSAFNFALLFYFDARLAWVATLLVLLSMLVTGVAGFFEVRHQREVSALQGKISGMVLEFVNGIARFRVTGTEGRAFARWAGWFSQQRQATFRSQMVSNGLRVFQAVYPVLASMTVFAVIASGNRVSTGVFLAFTAAFTQFLLASLMISAALIAILNVVPLYERARPILEALPEVDPAKADPGELRGQIEVSHVAFGYKPDEPLVLKDVSLSIRPGEFVALVGPSGSGKSTLMRLLMGFEKPLAGVVYYDRQDLTGLDVEAVRHQIGVVLQNGKLISGDIFTNIVGSAPLTVDDAMEAIRLVGLKDELARMPMGLHTIISDGGGNLSGGQRQRLLIARAIVHKPRLLFFDEATSALDNRTQAIVSRSLEQLKATRVVVAHRLSTIINADQIFVIANGVVAQSGSYPELMEAGGLFADLVRRQLWLEPA